MVFAPIKVSVPGSIMLFGEHAVLENHTALVMAIDKKLSLTLSPLPQKDVHIQSDLGEYKTQLDNLQIKKPFQFILAVLKHYEPVLNTGLQISVTSEFSAALGFGSSAAVTVALITALEKLLYQTNNLENIFLTARQVIQAVQGFGSGADALASTFGGVLAYRMDPLWFKRFDTLLPGHLIYSGYKTATPLVIQHVKTFQAANPTLVNEIYKEINALSLQAIIALENQDLPMLKNIIALHDLCQKKLTVSDSTLDALIETVNHDKNLRAKISGSGLGDCIWVLGDLSEKVFPNKIFPLSAQFNISTSLQGVMIHE